MGDPRHPSPRSSSEAWQRRASFAFVIASTLITLTAIVFALGLLSLPAVVVAVALAAVAMGYGLYARRRTR